MIVYACADSQRGSLSLSFTILQNFCTGNHMETQCSGGLNSWAWGSHQESYHQQSITRHCALQSIWKEAGTWLLISQCLSEEMPVAISASFTRFLARMILSSLSLFGRSPLGWPTSANLPMYTFELKTLFHLTVHVPNREETGHAKLTLERDVHGRERIISKKKKKIKKKI